MFCGLDRTDCYSIVMAKLIIVLCLIGFVWGKEPFTLDEFLQKSLVNKEWNGVWNTENTFLYKNSDGQYMEYDASSKTERQYLNMDVLASYPGATFKESHDRKYILIKYNVTPLHRHSTLAQYAIHKLEGNEDDIDVADKALLQYCDWTPYATPTNDSLKSSKKLINNAVVYVLDNNIYYHNGIGASSEKLAYWGKPGVYYNGVPDWIYEEEVASSISSMWFSPDGNAIGYLYYDDENVDTYSYTLYGDQGTIKNQYPTLVDIKYPKVGRNNPNFGIKIFNLNFGFEIEPIFVTDPSNHVLRDGPVWVNNDDNLMLFMNRIQNEATLMLWELRGSKLSIATYNESKGWLEIEYPVFNSDLSFYVQLEPINNVPSISISKLKDEQREQLSSGNKTVTSIYGLDETNDLVYFGASGENDHAQQHVYSININTKEEKCLTCNMETPSGICRYATALFSKDMSYMTKICQGPGPNYITIDKSIADDENSIIWEQNSELLEKLENKFMPEVKDLTITLTDGFTAAVRLLLPPNLDQNKAYPMIVEVDAAPGTNQIKDAFSLGFENYLVSNREYIYAYIDGRGSGRRGNDLMFQVYKRLGTVEIEDQIYVTKELQDRFPYIDKTRTCIWGWNYGGFSAAWAMVKDTENVFKCGLSVAPITNFANHDSLYTERYMGLLDSNLEGYKNTDVTRHAEAFRNKTYMLVHGTADVSVHYQHSAMLSKALQLADVPFTQMAYQDEGNSLRGVSSHLYHSIDKYWADNFHLDNE